LPRPDRAAVDVRGVDPLNRAARRSVFSGPVAAHAYRLLRGRALDVAVIAGPSHFLGFEASLCTQAADSRRHSASADRCRMRCASIAESTPLVVTSIRGACPASNSLGCSAVPRASRPVDADRGAAGGAISRASTAPPSGASLASALRGRKSLLSPAPSCRTSRTPSPPD